MITLSGALAGSLGSYDGSRSEAQAWCVCEVRDSKVGLIPVVLSLKSCQTLHLLHIYFHNLLFTHTSRLALQL